MTLRTPKSSYSSVRLPSYARHRSHLISTQVKRVWGKSPRWRTGESQVPQQPNRGSNLGFPGGNPWARRSRSNPPARGNACVRILVNSEEHLTPVAGERGKRRTGKSAKSGWTKEATYHLCWMAWRVQAKAVKACRYQAVKFVRDVPPMAGKADHSPDSLKFSGSSAGAGVDRGTKMASDRVLCIASHKYPAPFFVYGCSETATAPDHLLVVPLQVTGVVLA